MPARAPRSLTIHYAARPEPGPVSIRTVIERAGTLAEHAVGAHGAGRQRDRARARGLLGAVARPGVADAADARRGAARRRRARPGTLLKHGAPPFTQHLVLQPRIGAHPVLRLRAADGGRRLAGPGRTAADRRALARVLQRRAVPAAVHRARPTGAAPTIDLTIHFRAPMPRVRPRPGRAVPRALSRRGLLHEGFFEEDGVIWAPDGTVLAQSRQLATRAAACRSIELVITRTMADYTAKRDRRHGGRLRRRVRQGPGRARRHVVRHAGDQDARRLRRLPRARSREDGQEEVYLALDGLRLDRHRGRARGPRPGHARAGRPAAQAQGLRGSRGPAACS